MGTIVKRDLLDHIMQRIDRKEVILITGARQVGKTTLMKEIERELKKRGEKTLFINLEDRDYLIMMNESPKNLLKFLGEGKTYVFIDEIQYLDDPTHFVKFLYDEYKDRIKLVVSGSSAFYLDRKFRDSLAGRKRLFILNTFSFKEFLRAKGKEELLDKYELLPVRREVKNLLEEYCIYGGYPEVVMEKNIAEKKEILKELVNSYVKKDAIGADIRNEHKFFQLMKLLSGRAGKLINKTEISRILQVSVKLIDNYLYLMEKAFYIARVSPFYTNKTKEITKRKKIFFRDTGLRNVLINDFKFLEERSGGDRGQLVENLFFRVLMDFYPIEDIKFWISKGGGEVDFIVEEKAGYEIKYTGRKINIKKYKEFEDKYKIKVSVIDFEKIPEIYIKWMKKKYSY